MEVAHIGYVSCEENVNCNISKKKKVASVSIYLIIMVIKFIFGVKGEEKGKLSPLTGRGGLYGCEMLRIPHCLDNRLTVNCEFSSYLTGSTICLHKVKLSP
jgi:hypothetical protein